MYDIYIFIYTFFFLVLISSFLGIRNNFRFKRLIRTVRMNNGSASVINKLNYFKDMNNMICLILFLYGSSFFILCIDGLTDAQVIAHNKFASDVIISNANICAIFYYILFVSPSPQLFPKKDYL